MAKTTGTSAVADRPTDALWLAALPTPRIAVARNRQPAGMPAAPAEGVLSGLHDPITDMALSPDGLLLVAAHRGADALSLIDTGGLTVRATVEGIAEPGRLVIADRIYVTSAGITEDGLVAIDISGGTALGTREIDAHLRGLAVNPAGDTLFIARCGEDGADVAAISVESGAVGAIPVSAESGAAVETVRLSADGTRLYASVATTTGDAVVVSDVRSRRLLRNIRCSGSVADIAVHRDGRRAVAAGWDPNLGGVLTVIDTVAGRIVAIAEIGGLSTQVVLSGSVAYVVSGDHVVVVDVAAGRVIDTIAVGRAVSCIAVNSAGTQLYIADFEGTVESRSIAGDSLLLAVS